LLTRTAEHSYRVVEPGQPDQEFHLAPGADVARLARLRQGEHTIELRYTDRGTLREIVDSRGRLVRVTCDAAGRVLRLALAESKAGKPETTLLAYEYDHAGNLVRATDLNRTTLTFAYDAANRMTRRTDRRGYSFHFRYDDQGRCVHSRGDDGLFEVFLDYRPDARTTVVRRGDGGRWEYTYDDGGNLTRVTDPYGNATRFVLDHLGRPVQEIDPNGNVTQLHYDGPPGGPTARHAAPVGVRPPPRAQAHQAAGAARPGPGPVPRRRVQHRPWQDVRLPRRGHKSRGPGHDSSRPPGRL
jgi:YD repeat-containing protein